MTYDDFVKLGLELPGVEEAKSFGTPALKVRGKLLARWREDDVVVLRVDIIEKQMLLETQPDVFFTTPHYDGYPAVLARLSHADPVQMRDLLEEYWCRIAPVRLVKSWEAANVETEGRP